MSSWWPLSWLGTDKRDFEVVIYEEDYKELCAWVLRKPHIETGGDLFGLWADEYSAVIQLALGPGKQCRRTSASFYQDVEYLQEVGSYLTQNEGVCHIGEWHSHHQLGLARPSGGDENTVWNNMPTYKLPRFVIFIANIEASYQSYKVNIGCFLFEIDSKGYQLPVLQGKFKILRSENPFSRKKEVSMKRNKGAEEKRGDEFDINIKHLDLIEEQSPLITMKRRNFEVAIYEEDYKKLCAWVLRKPNIETGGDLFGLWVDEQKAVIQLALGPGKDCRRTTTSFYQDVRYLEDVGSYLTKKEGVCHIGEWHSHHQLGLARPSGGDENTVWNNMPTYKLSRFVIFIANIEASYHSYKVNIGCFLFEIDSEGNRLPVLQGKFKILHFENLFSRKREVNERRIKGEEEKRGDEFNIDIKKFQLIEEPTPSVTMTRLVNNKRNKPIQVDDKDQPQPKKRPIKEADKEKNGKEVGSPRSATNTETPDPVTSGGGGILPPETQLASNDSAPADVEQEPDDVKSQEGEEGEKGGNENSIETERNKLREEEEGEAGGGHGIETKERSGKKLGEEEEDQTEQIVEDDEIKGEERTAAEEKEQKEEDDETKTKERSGKKLREEEHGQTEQKGEDDEIKGKGRTAAEDKEQKEEDDETKTKERSGKKLREEEHGQTEQKGEDDEIKGKERTATEEKEQKEEDDETKTKERSGKKLREEEHGQTEQKGEDDEIKGKERTAAEGEKKQIEEDEETNNKGKSEKKLGEQDIRATEAETMKHHEADKEKAKDHDNQQNKSEGDQRNAKEDDPRSSNEEERKKTIIEARQSEKEQENPEGSVEKGKNKRSSHHDGLQGKRANAEGKPEHENPEAGASVHIKGKTAEKGGRNQALDADSSSSKEEKEDNGQEEKDTRF